MLYYDRIDISEGTDPIKSSNIKECMICHYWFLNHGFEFQDSICNGCHDLKSDIAIVTVKNFDYRCIIHKSLNISTGRVMKNPEMLKFVPDHLKAKKMCKHAAKKLPYLLRYVFDQYNTQQMCDKAIPENGGTLKYVPDCYKNQEMCNKATENYPHALDFAPECYKTQKMCGKAVHTYSSTIKLVPECFMTQEMRDKAVNSYFFYIRFYF